MGKKKGPGKKRSRKGCSDKRGAKKKKLGKANRKNRRIPPFVMLKTSRRVTVNRYRRDWRTDKLCIKDEE